MLHNEYPELFEKFYKKTYRRNRRLARAVALGSLIMAGRELFKAGE